MANKKAVVAVIDAGGRGAALIHKYSQSPSVGQIIAIPGNDLMQVNSRVPTRTFQDLKTTNVEEIIKLCKKFNVDLVDVAQDNAVEAGLVDRLLEEGFKVIGPTQAAGQIEWDKAWARNFMKKYNIPSPAYKVCTSQKEGLDFIKNRKAGQWFIKASGLAEGKGAIPAEDKEEAINAIKQMVRFGKAGETFLIEEWLDGEEFSFFAISDGETYQIIGGAQDHKRLYNGDFGPNTGGVGCSTPPLVVDKKIYSQAEKIIKQTIDGLRKENRKYSGIIYLGAIVVKNKVFVIEFNARWGDPEAEVLIPGIKNDFYKLCSQVAQGKLSEVKLSTDGLARVAVTGLLNPDTNTGVRKLSGLARILKNEGVIFYPARVIKVKNNYFVSSGRLFHVVGSGKTVIEARAKAYEAISGLFVEGNSLHYRTDIGWRDMARQQQR